MMSNNDFEGFSDNDWDDSWDLVWSEFDWERHLREQDEVLRTYLAHYEKHIARADRIDEVAHIMGWDEDSWTNDESSAMDDSIPDDADVHFPSSADSQIPIDPYTIQKHPVYISTHSMFLWLQRAWEIVAPAGGPALSTRTVLAFSGGISRAEHNGLLATHSLDMGDFSLAVCQLKRALAELNSVLHHLHSVDENSRKALTKFKKQALIRIFDIREIWLRVMRDCRVEIERRVRGGEN